MLALAVSTADKVRQISGKDLAFLGLGILALIIAVALLKRAAKVNGIVFFLIAGAAMFVVGVTWIYQRNEPKFMTPFIDKVAQFFPSAPTPYSQRPGAIPGTTTPQKPGAPSAPQKPGNPPAQQKPAPPPPPSSSKVY